MKIVVTRPEKQAKGLCNTLQQWGAEVECFPTIEITETRNPLALELAVKSLNQIDIAIFVSRAAVEYTFPLIRRHWTTFPSPQWSAIGPGTAAAMQEFGIESILIPSPPYESESFLAMPALQNVLTKRILLFRGNSGRALIPTVLSKRGALVQIIEAYQRHLPRREDFTQFAHWQIAPPDLIISTSIEGLQNLILLLGEQRTAWLKTLPIVVVGLRMFNFALTLGFRKPILSQGADDASLLDVLKGYFK